MDTPRNIFLLEVIKYGSHVDWEAVFLPVERVTGWVIGSPSAGGCVKEVLIRVCAGWNTAEPSVKSGEITSQARNDGDLLRSENIHDRLWVTTLLLKGLCKTCIIWNLRVIYWEI